MLTLGIETSCDETAAAVLKDGQRICSNVIASQIAVHRKFGGVVPEIASRHHLENIVPIVNQALEGAGIGFSDLGGIAVTQGPGLVGSLLVGVNYAKAIAYVEGIPIAPVNHLEGHLYSAPLQWLRDREHKTHEDSDWSVLFPALCLVVSGGHTSLYWVKRLGNPSDPFSQIELVGRTRDDAAGEAFDKVSKLLCLGYPGGPIIDQLAVRGDPQRVKFSATRISAGGFDFSFSGIKTAVLRYVQTHFEQELPWLRANHTQVRFLEQIPQSVLDLVASFQLNVVENLLANTLKVAETRHPQSILVAGGVACNRLLRERFQSRFSRIGLPVYFPSPVLSTDNAAMIAAAGYPKLVAGIHADLTLNADVSLKLHDQFPLKED
ncbi:MAG: tRNA (adenosine(37)-N6)-threonylcarbamoyltransferase complex transferase subunit TsaD [Terriglobia bacterium]